MTNESMLSANELETLSETPVRLQSILNEISKESWTTRPSANAFSALEHVCHLRDLEREGYGARIKRILSENLPALDDFDGATLAVERAYNSQELEPALQDFVSTRKENVALLSGASADQMLRLGHLEGVGEITLVRLMQLMVEHDTSHLRELSELSNHLRKDN